MDRHEHVALGYERVVPEDLVVGGRDAGVRDGGVEHDVAHGTDGRPGDALAFEVRHGRRRRYEQQIGGVVGQHPVDLLGHPPIEAAQPGLDVGDRQVEFGGRKGTGQGRVGVAEHEHPVGLGTLQNGFDRLDHPPGVLAVRSATDTEVVVGLRQPKVAEERPRHVVVEVLARVDQHLAKVGPRPNGARYDAGLHELRPGADDGGDRPHEWVSMFTG